MLRKILSNGLKPHQSLTQQPLSKTRKIASILATGGPGMVNAALKSGNPSMGVGAGNGAIYVDATAHIDRAVEDCCYQNALIMV